MRDDRVGSFTCEMHNINSSELQKLHMSLQSYHQKHQQQIDHFGLVRFKQNWLYSISAEIFSQIPLPVSAALPPPHNNNNAVFCMQPLVTSVSSTADDRFTGGGVTKVISRSWKHHHLQLDRRNAEGLRTTFGSIKTCRGW